MLLTNTGGGMLSLLCTKNHHFLKFRGAKNHHFLDFGGPKIIIFWKIVKIIFFSKMCVHVTKWSFFTKSVEKCPPQIHENWVLLRENAFFKMWQGGRINFFWGGFPTFMVYALPQRHPAYYFPVFVLCFPQNKHRKVVRIGLHTENKI